MVSFSIHSQVVENQLQTQLKIKKPLSRVEPNMDLNSSRGKPGERLFETK